MNILNIFKHTITVTKSGKGNIQTTKPIYFNSPNKTIIINGDITTLDRIKVLGNTSVVIKGQLECGNIKSYGSIKIDDLYISEHSIIDCCGKEFIVNGQDHIIEVESIYVKNMFVGSDITCKYIKGNNIFCKGDINCNHIRANKIRCGSNILSNYIQVNGRIKCQNISATTLICKKLLCKEYCRINKINKCESLSCKIFINSDDDSGARNYWIEKFNLLGINDLSNFIAENCFDDIVSISENYKDKVLSWPYWTKIEKATIVSFLNNGLKNYKGFKK